MRRRWRTAAAKQRLRQSDRLELAQLPEIHRRSQGEPGGGVGCWHRAGTAPAIAATCWVRGGCRCCRLLGPGDAASRDVGKAAGRDGEYGFWLRVECDAGAMPTARDGCGSYPCVCACRHGLPVLTEKREGVCRPRTRAGMRAGNLRGPTLPLSCRFTKSERNVRIGRRSDGFGRQKPRPSDQARLMSPGSAHRGSEALPVLPLQPPAARLPRDADRERAAANRHVRTLIV